MVPFQFNHPDGLLYCFENEHQGIFPQIFFGAS
jgi:hypothetical protein